MAKSSVGLGSWKLFLSWNFWTAGLGCGSAFWKTSFESILTKGQFFSPTKSIKQRLEYLKLAIVGYFSNMIFFALDKNHYLFIHLPRFLCLRNSHKSSSSGRGYWAYLPRIFLLLLFCFLMLPSPAIQFVTCFLSILNLFAVCDIFLLFCNAILIQWV